jgi:2-aminoadipate transaminase
VARDFELPGGAFDKHFSARARKLRASDVRELLKLLQNPEMISFAGGLPNPESFPSEIIREIANDVLANDAGKALQYGITEGYLPLREALADRMAKKGMDITTDNVATVSGSQQVIDLMGKVFIDPGDVIVVSAPTYLTALTGFSVYDARFETVPIDDNNMRMDMFEEKIGELSRKGVRPKIVYALPNFQNPAGVTMPEKSRRRLVDLANEHDLIVLEDDPYGELRYRGEDIRPIKSFDDEGRVVYMSTFSKILCPGLRVGWMVGNTDILRKLIIAKQSSDVCTNVLGQVISCEYITRGHIDSQVAKIRQLYSGKLDIMLKGMDELMPDSVRWVPPEGGMFLWATLPDGASSVELLEKAVQKKVAFVSGRAFYPDPADGLGTLRLNFTYPSDEMITEGLRRLGSVFQEELG